MNDARSRTRIVTALIAMVAVFGLAAVGIAWALAAPASPYEHGHRVRTYTVIGKIEAQRGSDWTVAGPDHQKLDVTVSPATLAEAHRDFTVGQTVTVRGTGRHGSIIAATVAAR